MHLDYEVKSKSLSEGVPVIRIFSVDREGFFLAAEGTIPWREAPQWPTSIHGLLGPLRSALKTYCARREQCLNTK